MAGGLVQLISYGSQDIFLTGSPQITFFKILYRRHTNFSIESKLQHFIGIANFNEEISSVVDKIGDLMNRVYLEIELPKANLVKDFMNWQRDASTVKKEFEEISKYRQLLLDYFRINIDIIRKLNILINTNNIPFTEIENIMTNPNFINALIETRKNLSNYIASNFESGFTLIQEINSFDIYLLFLSISNSKNYPTIDREELCYLKKNKIRNLISKQIYTEMHSFYSKINDEYLAKEKIYRSLADKNYSERHRFAWVEEIGHAIIDYIEIRIGNQVMDKHTGDWMIAFNKLFLPGQHLDNYNKMIGNVPELTIYDDSAKNSYKLIIPFQFWFCRNTGLSIPLISLKYHDVMFTVKLKDLSKLCYVDDESLSIPGIQSKYNLNLISTNLYVDYVYLDNEERRRFASSTHEYLIETVQYNEINNINGNWINTHLNFTNPTKFIVWFIQPESYRSNPNGNNKCEWNRYSTVKSTHVRLNTCNRTDPTMDPIFFDTVQSTQYFNSAVDGLYNYSFALNPREHQPSSSINLSRIDDLGIHAKFNSDFMEKLKSMNCNAYMGIYTMSYNILRFMSGMAGLAVIRI